MARKSLRRLSSTMTSVLKSLGDESKTITSMTEPLNMDGAHPLPSTLTKDIQDLVQFIDQGPAFTPADLPAYIDAVRNLNGVGLDDRKFLLEKLLTLMARLPKDLFSQKLQEFVIQILYKDLPHPPSGYLSVQSPNVSASKITPAQWTVPYAFRTADGSDYNPFEPTMGKAGSPYARSVPSIHPLNPAALPAPELVFDQLLKRDKFVEHPGGISSLFFAFADFIIHSIFNTNTRDWTKNDVSSYLDLSPLYGSSDADLDKVRRKDGTGRLWDDVFADWRLLNMPPSVGALIVLFNRNHNFIAERLLAINENGNFSNPPPSDAKALAKQEDELFQRARLVNCGFFMKVILGDYVGVILGLVRDGSTWRLDPLSNSRDALSHEVTPRGEGNVCSIEFNLLYRWHAATSQPDTQWTEKLFSNLLQGLDPATITVDEFRKAASKWRPDPDIKKWTFDELKRDANGRFSDADLGRILLDATESPASAFKARGTPEVLRVIELLSIEQARTWGTCSMNEFRTFMGLKPYASFKEWNTNPEIYKAAETLYHDIDNLELHVGMQAEEAKEPMPGAGLCPGYTISRAILSDAVALTRGDRFLTVEFTPYNLSNWGYQDCQYDDEDGTYGGILPRMLYRHLPGYYPVDSAYAKFPFMVPKTMKGYASKLPDHVDAKYSWTRPSSPTGPPIVVTAYSDVSKILANKNEFVGETGKKAEMLARGIPTDSALVERVILDQKVVDNAASKMEDLVDMLIKKNTMKGVAGKTHYIDIVKDVLNVAPVHWIANEIIGLPMKTDLNQYGVFRDHELYGMFSNVCSYLYLNQDPGSDWTLRERSAEAVTELSKYLRAHLAKITRGNFNVDALKDTFGQWVAGRNDHSESFLTDLAKAAGRKDNDSTLDKLTASLILEVVPTAPLFSKALTHVVNFFLQDGKVDLRAKVAALAKTETPQADAEVMKFVYEALRIDPPISSITLKAKGQTSLAAQSVLAGQPVTASLIQANLDSSVFSDPSAPNFARPTTKPGIFGFDQKGLLATKMFERVAPRVLHAVFALPELKYGPKPSGKLSRFTQTIGGIPQQMYIDFNGKLTNLPTSMLVQYTA